ncbi:chorismate mutase [Allopontixanthobacter sediminis]|uniref:chorismate mutase n=1 Tax=Allopontixanthobacter sediminis TaxID=1689985 RepID=A0A845AXI9_9SPHN|nr:chorismate mutase [Allopontixanthobacter sediminis]MXP43721.1 chorismate mutase [Allopontixanthobacter sediminis]
MPKSPENCETMDDVREGVDHVDRELMALFARRFGYMEAAARIKPEREAVRDEPRKAKVISAAMADAKERGLPETVIGQMWEALVEGSIAYEFARWDDIDR